ncbi:DNA-directed RNA polymerase III subunit 2 [Tanacetum coccineum]
MKVRGLVKEHLDSFNYFVTTGIKKIVAANSTITSEINPTNVYLRYEDVRIGLPSEVVDGETKLINPQTCRLSDNTSVVGYWRVGFIGECPLDPGGYFIVNGNEKVLLIQEQLSNNRIIIERDKNKCIQASIMSSTETSKSKTTILMERENIVLVLNSFTAKVPIMVVFKAMGMESDQEVVQMLERDPIYATLLMPSMEECSKHGIYTQYQALEFLEKKLSRQSYKESGALHVLRHVFLSNIREIVTSYITEGLVRALSTGNWDIQRFKMHKKGVSQALNRLSFIGAVSFMTKIQTQFEKSMKVSGPRALQPSQWGMLCPCDTPEGEGCGLVKNLALMAHVTTDQDEGPVATLCLVLGSTASDGGRICRPLVIADKGVSRVKEHHRRELMDGIRSFASFSQEGLIEYLDVHEENNALIALYEGEATEETTHIEIEPFTILGVCAGLIPFPHHNQSPRNTYQCAMGKQAMGSIAYNQVGFDKLGAGQNATVAVMSYSGYDIEDAIVMNKSSLDRGFGHCIVMKRLTATFQKYKSGQDEFCRPNRTDLDPKKQILDNDGIATPGEILRPHDTYFMKYVPTSGQPELRQQRYDARAEEAVVDRVTLSTDKKNNCLKVKIMTERSSKLVGDKFSSRHGQKGVCGCIIQQEDLPFSERGICPDLIMIPMDSSRMTVGKMIELLGSKAGVSCGKFHYGSAFGEPSGHAHKARSITGTPLQAYIFMGPIYYQKLKHMVVDKMHARGLRIGEMERDCMIAYGAANLTYERLMLSSDPFEAQSVMAASNMALSSAFAGQALKVAPSELSGTGRVSFRESVYLVLVDNMKRRNEVPHFKSEMQCNTNEGPYFTSEMQCDTTIDDCEMNAQSEMLLVQGEIANVAQREFAPPIEEVVYVHGQSLSASPLSHACVERCHVKPAGVHRVNVSRNVKRRLLTSHLSMPTNASMFMGIAKQQVGPAYTVENYGNKDRNCVPISRVFDCFKSIRTANIGADRMAQTGEHNFGPTYTIENRVDEDRNCIPISKVFNRFMSMRTANIRADCMAQPGI